MSQIVQPSENGRNLCFLCANHKSKQNDHGYQRETDKKRNLLHILRCRGRKRKRVSGNDVNYAMIALPFNPHNFECQAYLCIHSCLKGTVRFNLNAMNAAFKVKLIFFPSRNRDRESQKGANTQKIHNSTITTMDNAQQIPAYNNWRNMLRYTVLVLVPYSVGFLLSAIFKFTIIQLFSVVLVSHLEWTFKYWFTVHSKRLGPEAKLNFVHLKNVHKLQFGQINWITRVCTPYPLDFTSIFRESEAYEYVKVHA